MTVDIIWKSIRISRIELNLSKVLRCGQAFRWHNINNVWTFTRGNKIILLKQSDDEILYSWISNNSKSNVIKQEDSFEDVHLFLCDYFNLSINLGKLYALWLELDKKYKKNLENSPFTKFTGIRILRQDPWETLISFICSSNNNVKRISKMCDSLCKEFGTYINEYEDVRHYSFPSPEVLSSSPDVEQKLRSLGFGYRAKYIYQTACKFTNNIDYPSITIQSLNQLRQEDYETAHKFLLQLSGVGPKVADCICLMALDKNHVVSIDTHVYQIAVRDYKFKGKKDMKTLNNVTYQQMRTFFYSIFGDYAGWAQSVLFTSDLTDLNNGLNQIESK